jgi:hypothetical protein
VFIRDEFGAVDLVEGALVRARPHAFRPARLEKRREAGVILPRAVASPTQVLLCGVAMK